MFKNSFDSQNKGIKERKNKYHEIEFTYKITYIYYIYMYKLTYKKLFSIYLLLYY